MHEIHRIGPGLSLDTRNIEWRFVRASGPGGQNVNKVATAVELRFDIDAATYLPLDLRARLRVQAANRLDAEGRLLIEASRCRTQERNRQDAIARLIDLIRTASVRPRRRVATRPTRASVERRLEGKRRSSVRKQSRSRPVED